MEKHPPAPTDTPPRIACLPIDPQRGVPVPWFVAWIAGKPDFRVIGRNKMADAVNFRLCWVCGQERGANVSFVVGPMCAVNRTSAEPPAHRDCAIYSAKYCPFLTKPHMHRREANMPEGTVVSGEMIRRNPGIALVWSTRDWRPFRAPRSDGGQGVLFAFGDPSETLWFREGRAATRAEVDESIRTGLPLLEEMADQQDGGRAALAKFVERAQRYLPEAS
jgi:hypothetical protein